MNGKLPFIPKKFVEKLSKSSKKCKKCHKTLKNKKHYIVIGVKIKYDNDGNKYHSLAKKCKRCGYINIARRKHAGF